MESVGERDGQAVAAPKDPAEERRICPTGEAGDSHSPSRVWMSELRGNREKRSVSFAGGASCFREPVQNPAYVEKTGWETMWRGSLVCGLSFQTAPRKKMAKNIAGGGAARVV